MSFLSVPFHYEGVRRGGPGCKCIALGTKGMDSAWRYAELVHIGPKQLAKGPCEACLSFGQGITGRLSLVGECPPDHIAGFRTRFS